MTDIPELKVLRVPIDEVIPYEKNARVASKTAVAKIAQSIKEYGFTQPIVVDKKRVIITGHTRLMAAKQLGMTEVPIIVVRHLSPEKVRLYRIADNRVAEETKWDDDLLKEEMKELAEIVGEDNLADLTGFSGKEMDEIIPVEDVESDSESDEEEEEDEDEKPSASPGRSKILHSCPKCGYEWHSGDPPPKPETLKIKKKKKVRDEADENE